MFLIPYKSFTIYTDLKLEDIIVRLKNSIETSMSIKKWVSILFKNSKHKPYQGSINKNKLNIFRIIEGRNGLNPTIKGFITDDNSVTVIRISMRPNLFIISFLIFWYSFLMYILIISIIEAKYENILYLIPFLIVPLIFIQLSFIPEVKKSSIFFKFLLSDRISKE